VTDPTENARPLVIGMAARGGITAALLAQMGFGGPPGILDPGKYTIYDAYAGEMHLDRLTDRLGEDFWIARTGGFKRYPCCGDIHSGLDALLALMYKHEIRPGQIEAVIHRVKADRAPVIDNNPLKSHCAQYILAVAAVSGQILPDDILRDRRDEPPVREMFERVRLVADREMDGWPAGAPAVVEIALKDGRRVTERVDAARGRQENPMTPGELEAKFYDLATRRLARRDATRLLELIQGLETVGSVGQIGDLLRG
jgi:2-methylcitrate dehydratase PrpD